MAHLGKSRRQLFEEVDLPELCPLPEQPYQFATWKPARVNIDYHVAFEKHFYSVPHSLIHQEVEIKAIELMVEIFHCDSIYGDWYVMEAQMNSLYSYGQVATTERDLVFNENIEIPIPHWCYPDKLPFCDEGK